MAVCLEEKPKHYGDVFGMFAASAPQTAAIDVTDALSEVELTLRGKVHNTERQ